MNSQRNIAKNKQKKTGIELSLLLLVKTCCNFSLLSVSRSAAKFCNFTLKMLLVFQMLCNLFSIKDEVEVNSDIQLLF